MKEQTYHQVPVPRLLYGKREVAAALGLSLRSVDNLILHKKLSVVRVGGRTMIRQKELERFAKQGTGEAQ